MTPSIHSQRHSCSISTHTSRVGCDLCGLRGLHSPWHFYSHIPCGMWLAHSFPGCRRCVFLLTHPVWDVTSSVSASLESSRFLLTHPVWDVTLIVCYLFRHCDGFLLTHPVWDVTTIATLVEVSTMYFYSHIPCGMWPGESLHFYHKKIISTHTSRVGCDC